MITDPVYEGETVGGMIDLVSRGEIEPPANVCAPRWPAGDSCVCDPVHRMKPTQRDVMRALWRRFGPDPEQTIRAYAEAELRGEVQRKSDVHHMPAAEYASRLYADGIKKGWLG